MRRLRALAVLALGGAVAASAEPFDADYDVVDDALAPSPLVSPEAPSYLDDANAWVDRLRRRAEDIAAARPLVNDAYRGFFEDLAHVRPEHASPWPRLWRNAGASAEDESAKVVPRFRFATEEAEGAARESALGRLAAPAAAGDAVLGALEVSEEILARTSPDALDAASDVARVIQEQTELAKAALAAAETRDDDYDDDDSDVHATRLEVAKVTPVSASFAVDPRGPFASFPASGPGSFPDTGTIRSIADPGTYGALGSRSRDEDWDPKGFGGVAGVVAARASAAAARLYSAAFDEDARAEHSVAAKHALARLVDLTLEGQANAPVGRYFVDPNAVDRAKAAMDRVSERVSERAFGSETGGEDSASPYDASFARGVERAASLREDEAEREARVRAELDLAGVIERQGEEGTRKRSGETENTKTLS